MTLVLPEWPMFGLADDVRPAMRAAQAAGETVALATLYAVGDGGPRPPGSQMLITPTAAAGFLSGGCIEADIALHAAGVIEDGEPLHLVYGQGSPWPDIQLLCGARLDILVERVGPDDPALITLLADTEARRPAVWVTDGRARRLDRATPGRTPKCEVHAQPFELKRLYEPIPRLVVFGSDPIALATASLLRPTTGRLTTKPCWRPCRQRRPMSASSAPVAGRQSAWRGYAPPASARRRWRGCGRRSGWTSAARRRGRSPFPFWLRSSRDGSAADGVHGSPPSLPFRLPLR